MGIHVRSKDLLLHICIVYYKKHILHMCIAFTYVCEIVYRYIYICKHVMYIYIIHIYVKSWGCLYIIYCELCSIKGKLNEMGKKAELRFSSGYIQHTHNKDILGNCFYCLITECPCQRNKAFFVSTTDYFVISGVH